MTKQLFNCLGSDLKVSIIEEPFSLEEAAFFCENRLDEISKRMASESPRGEKYEQLNDQASRISKITDIVSSAAEERPDEGMII